MLGHGKKMRESINQREVWLWCCTALSLSLSHKLRATTFVGSANMQQPLESELTHIHFPLSCLIGVGFWVSLPHFLSL